MCCTSACLTPCESLEGGDDGCSAGFCGFWLQSLSPAHGKTILPRLWLRRACRSPGCELCELLRLRCLEGFWMVLTSITLRPFVSWSDAVSLIVSRCFTAGCWVLEKPPLHSVKTVADIRVLWAHFGHTSVIQTAEVCPPVSIPAASQCFQKMASRAVVAKVSVLPRTG